jgi:hypothetical protein
MNDELSEIRNYRSPVEGLEIVLASQGDNFPLRINVGKINAIQGHRKFIGGIGGKVVPSGLNWEICEPCGCIGLLELESNARHGWVEQYL